MILKMNTDENITFGNGGFPTPLTSDENVNVQRPAHFNGPTLNGGDQSALCNSTMSPRELDRIEETQPAANQIIQGPLNKGENVITDTSTVAIPLPPPEYLLAKINSETPSTSSTGAETSRYISSTTFDHYDENGHRYVGLVNQAMTCYLNSLIQTLYMTPEFRNAIYKWKFNGSVSDEANNIPYQLQKLFLLLQTSDKSSLETKELTASFGWESNEAYDQHDVQELCRIMFDALEHRWRKTENRSVIQDLYKGTMEDYVKCLRCGTEKIRKDVFLDLPLAVKQFGATESYKTIEEALNAFIKPEVLNGNNQYECERCTGKQDAEKGLRITEFPYMLTIQLKRFDFDYQTLHRIKLNDRITFPDYLDINRFVYSPNHVLSKMSYAAATKKPKPEPRFNHLKESDENPPDDPFMEPSTSEIDVNDENISPDKREWLNVPSDSQIIQQMLKRGKHVYELFSIMVHQGNATAGHYFAYIKNLDQNLWFCFNDSSVQAVTLNDIYRTFGGWHYGYMNNMNAYMLMYRQVSSMKDKSFIRTIELPQHLKDLLQKLKIQEEELERKQRHEKELVKIIFICNEESCMAKDPECKQPYNVLIHKDVSLDNVFSELLNKLNEEDSIMLTGREHPEKMGHFKRRNCARLILCDSNWVMKEVVVQYQDHAYNTNEDGIIEEGAYVVGGDEDYKRPLQTLLQPTYGTTSLFRQELYLMVDTKVEDNDEFYDLPICESYSIRNESRTLEIWVVDLCTQEIRFAKRICVSVYLTIGDIKRRLAELIPAVAQTEIQFRELIEQELRILRKKLIELEEEDESYSDGATEEKIITKILTEKLPCSVLIFENCESIPTPSYTYSYNNGANGNDTLVPYNINRNNDMLDSTSFKCFNVITTYISVATSDILWSEYHNGFSKMRQLIERKKFSMKLCVLLPPEDTLKLSRHSETAVITTAKDIDKLDSFMPPPPPYVITESSTKVTQQSQQRPIAVVAPTVVKPQKLNNSQSKIDLNFTETITDVDMPPEPAPTTTEPSTSDFLHASSEGEEVLNEQQSLGFALDDPTPPPPYSSMISGTISKEKLIKQAQTQQQQLNMQDSLSTLFDKQQDVSMQSISGSSMICHPGESDDVVMGGQEEDEESIFGGDDIDDQQQLLPPTGEDIEDPMGGSSCPSTPKISPVVSDASGDEFMHENISSSDQMGCGVPHSSMGQKQRENVEKALERIMMYSDDLRDASTIAATTTTTTEMATTTTTEIESRGESSTDSPEQPNSIKSNSELQQQQHFNSIRIVEKTETTNTNQSIVLLVDKRMAGILVKKWLSHHLNLDQSKFELLKHYNENSDGFDFHPTELDTVNDCLMHCDHLTLKVNLPPQSSTSTTDNTSSANGNDTVKQPQQENGNNDSQRWKRRERPLRIKIMSMSESDDQPSQPPPSAAH